MSSSTNPANTLFSFLALYLTTLFSLDAWSSARNSPYRAPGANSFYRPAAAQPSEYQAGMHGRGNRGPGGGGGGGNGRRGGGNVAETRDSRPAVGMGVTAGCGACM
ncbi:hypothetical protein IQ06DRAFT_289726, partial [Phaeosphaeriaceae sp. SRC1lsM3a]